MKTYRRALLAAAVLFVALPFSSCGDADDYAQTSTITLTSQGSTMIVKREMIFTVVATFPDPTTTTTTTTPTATVADTFNAPVINGCNTTIEYNAEGAGKNPGWQQLPGTGSTRTFMLEPKETGTLAVMARGKCTGSMEDWKYSAQLNVEVTDPVALGLPALTLTANPSSVVINNPVTFTLASTKPDKCTVRLKYQYSGGGFGVTTVNPATAGQFVLTPNSLGTLTVTATGWCAENPAAVSTVTTAVPVTSAVAATLPTITSVSLTAVTATPYTAGGGGINYTLSAVTPTGCTGSYTLTYTGSGSLPNPNVISTPTTGVKTIADANLVFGAKTLNISASGVCTENPTATPVQATPLIYSIN